MGWIAFLFALIAGTAITVQVRSDSQLKQSLGDPMGALVVNYVLALIGCDGCRNGPSLCPSSAQGHFNAVGRGRARPVVAELKMEA